MTRTTSVNIRETPMQRTVNKIIKATEEHGTARTTSVRIRETPMQKKQQTTSSLCFNCITLRIKRTVDRRGVNESVCW